MYEKRFKGSEAVRQLRFRQAKNDESARRDIRDAIKESIPYAPRLIEFPYEMKWTAKTTHGYEVFSAKYLRRSTHFPGIVPELVNDSGEYLLITWLTFASLLRLLNVVRKYGKEIKNFDFFM